MPALPKHVLYASVGQITQKHRELEAAPVMVFGTPFDADERSEVRMKNACEVFDSLPLEEGVVVSHLGTKMLYWKDANNEFRRYTKGELQELFAELIKQRTIRGTLLFSRLQQFKSNPGIHSVSQINTPAYWGL